MKSIVSFFKEKMSENQSEEAIAELTYDEGKKAYDQYISMRSSRTRIIQAIENNEPEAKVINIIQKEMQKERDNGVLLPKNMKPNQFFKEYLSGETINSFKKRAFDLIETAIEQGSLEASIFMERDAADLFNSTEQPIFG